MDVIPMGHLGGRRMELPGVCDMNEGHSHNFDHVTFVQRGSIKVLYKLPGDAKEYESRVFERGDFVEIKKDVWHTIKSMEPNTKYICLFNHRTPDGEIAERYTGWEDAYR